jgi:intracellular sulfur oxidation DsrE/DsrF family protein
MKAIQSTSERRSFLARFAGASTAFAAAFATKAQAQRTPAAAWRPGLEAKDDWMDSIPGRHRMLFDSTTPDAFGAALMYAGNFYLSNKDGYGLQDSDLAVLVVARHNSTPFAFNHAIWKKYGSTLSRMSNFKDPVTKEVPVQNFYMANGSLDGLLKRGAHVAVCQMATRQLVSAIAADAALDETTVFNEISMNLVPNSHLVPAGIVAVNRAQERGYAFVNA